MSIAIVGVGETDYTFRDERPVAAMVLEAIHRALADAGLRPEDVDGFVSETYSTVRAAPVDEISQRLGVQDRTFSGQMSLAGSGIVGAPQLARLAIEAGLATTVVAYYGINLSADTGGPVRLPRPRRLEGRVRDAVRVLRPARLLRRHRRALPPRVRPPAGGARRGGDVDAPARHAHAERAQAGPADDR